MFVFTLLGRGGQGVENAAKILSKAASLSGLYSQSFTSNTLSSRGEPVLAQVKIDKKYIKSRQIEESDFLLIFDKTLDIKDALKNVKEKSIVILNADGKKKIKLKQKVKIFYINATDIALQTVNKNLLDSVMCGALLRQFNQISLRSLKKVLEQEMPAGIAALEQGYKGVKR